MVQKVWETVELSIVLQFANINTSFKHATATIRNCDRSQCITALDIAWWTAAFSVRLSSPENKQAVSLFKTTYFFKKWEKWNTKSCQSFAFQAKGICIHMVKVGNKREHVRHLMYSGYVFLTFSWCDFDRSLQNTDTISSSTQPFRLLLRLSRKVLDSGNKTNKMCSGMLKTSGDYGWGLGLLTVDFWNEIRLVAWKPTDRILNT